jgi:hypothetical protein
MRWSADLVRAIAGWKQIRSQRLACHAEPAKLDLFLDLFQVV